MTSPVFLELDQVLRLHQELIDCYGGEYGTREIGLLQSAIAQPQTSFDGEMLHADIFEMAGAYLYHIVQNHPFVDGNKRTGAATAIVFLAINDIQIDIDEEELVELTIAVATGQASKNRIAECFRDNAH